MAIKVMANCGDQVLYTAEELGAALRTFAANTDYIIKNIGNQMSLYSTTSSLEVTVRTGEAMMCGRFIMITSNEKVTLPANTTGKLVLRIDLNKPVTREGVLTYVTGTPKSDNLNNTASGQYDMVLAEFVTSSSGVTTLTDKRVIKDAAGGGGDTPIPEPTSNIVCDLLWENATINAHQSFEAQTVTITNLKNYKLLLFMIYAGHGYDNDIVANRGVRDGDNPDYILVPFVANGQQWRIGIGRTRIYTMKDNGVQFSAAIGGEGTGGLYNYFNYPWRIYGIK